MKGQISMKKSGKSDKLHVNWGARHVQQTISQTSGAIVDKHQIGSPRVTTPCGDRAPTVVTKKICLHFFNIKRLSR